MAHESLKKQKELYEERKEEIEKELIRMQEELDILSVSTTPLTNSNINFSIIYIILLKNIIFFSSSTYIFLNKFTLLDANQGGNETFEDSIKKNKTFNRIEDAREATEHIKEEMKKKKVGRLYFIYLKINILFF